MSRALEEFLRGIDATQKAAERISSPSIGGQIRRTPEQLQLNGLHVVTFALLEEFLRQRTIEVLGALGRSGAKFIDFPGPMQLQILQETFKGITFHLNKGEDDRLTKLQVETINLHTTADENQNFSPSEFCFGKSQSNISLRQITEFLNSFGIQADSAFGTLLDRLSLQHLGDAGTIFKKVSENRHAAAHAFSLDFRHTEFIEDLKLGYKLLAFIYDTVLSQTTKSLKDSIIKKRAFQPTTAESYPLRSVRFDSIAQEWKVERLLPSHTETLRPIPKNRLEASLERLKTGRHDKDDTVFIIDSNGALVNWVQPI